MISILATTPLLLKHLAEKKILTLSAKKVQLQLQPPRPQRATMVGTTSIRDLSLRVPLLLTTTGQIFRRHPKLRHPRTIYSASEYRILLLQRPPQPQHPLTIFLRLLPLPSSAMLAVMTPLVSLPALPHRNQLLRPH